MNQSSDEPKAPVVRKEYRWGLQRFFWTDEEARWWIEICRKYGWSIPEEVPPA